MNTDNKMGLPIENRKEDCAGVSDTAIRNLLIDETETSIYVADYETDELLYLNDAAKAVLHTRGEVCPGQPCYAFLMHRTTPCPFCHKSLLSPDAFLSNTIKFPFNGREYRISSKISMLGERKVHIHYITDLTELLNKEKELRELTDKIPSGIGIFYAYPDGRIEQDYLNDGYFKMLGVTRDSRMEYSGFEYGKAIHPDDAAELQIKVESGILHNTQINHDVRIRRTDGSYKWVHVRAEIYKSTAEKVVLYCAFTDIDDLKKSLEQQGESHRTVSRLLKEAKASETRFKNIMDHVPGAMVVFEARDKMLWLKYISDACINITGFTAEETYARSGPDPLADVHPDSRAYFVEHEWEDIQQRKKLSYRYQLICKDGTYKWASLNLSPVEEDGKLLYFGVLRDLDAEEQKYQEKENIFNQLIGVMERAEDSELIAKGRYDITANTLEYYCRHGQEALDLPEPFTFDEARKLMEATAATPEQSQQIHIELNRDKLVQKYRDGKIYGTIEYKRLENTGAYFWTSLRYTLCLNPDTNHIMFFVYTYDVTRKMLEKSMLNMLGTTEYEVMGTIDVKTHYFETQAVLLPGVALDKSNKLATGNYDEVWGKLAEERIPEYERSQFLQQIKMETIVENLEKYNVYFTTYSVLEDKKLHRKKTQFCYLDALKETLFYYRSDISLTYAKEQEQVRVIEQALQLAKSANASKTEFFSRMSHDMRTPMNGILGLADLSAEENDPTVLKENIGKIKESGQYLLSLINDTLDYQRIESGRLQLEPQPFDCRTLVDSVVTMIKPSLEKKKIQFSVQQNNMDFDCYLMVDPVRIRQIFINLLSNAIKFTPEGGRIEVDCDCLNIEGASVHDVFKIRDTGVGMSEDFIKDRLFQPFAQEQNEQSLKYAGSGLGLSIVHSLVEMMGGSIEVESELGTGTTFTIYLDFEKVDEEVVAREKEKATSKQSNVTAALQGKKILLAEDHPLNAEIARKLLEKAGCHVTWVENGQVCVETIAAASPEAFDLILMDIRMPVMDGLTATKAIRALKSEYAKHVPILAMTANAYDEDIKKSLDAGMNGHISKPIVPATLYEAIACKT